MRIVNAAPDVVIELGRQGENNITTVIFPTADWAEEFGQGAFQLVHRRRCDPAPYPCNITVDDNGDVNWLVESADVFYDGIGWAQLAYVVGGAIAKSVVYMTSTTLSLGGGPLPQPVPDWIQNIYAINDHVTEAEQTTAQKALDAEAWAVGQRGGEDVPETDETYHNSAKYHSQQAGDSASAAAQSADDASGSAGAASDSADAAELSANQAAAFVGAPLTASTAAGMIDRTKVYVYVGSETGYTAGDWYYWNGSAWADGGVYNSIADDIATAEDIDNALYS